MGAARRRRVASLPRAGEGRGGRRPAVPPAGRLHQRLLHQRLLHPQLVPDSGRTPPGAAAGLQVHKRLRREVRRRRGPGEGLRWSRRLAAAARRHMERLGSLLLRRDPVTRGGE